MEPGQVVLPTGKSEEKLKQVLSFSMTSSPRYSVTVSPAPAGFFLRSRKNIKEKASICPEVCKELL